MPEYLTVAQVAEQVQVHPETVRVWLRSGLLPGRHVGQQWRVSQVDLTGFLEGEGGGIDEEDWRKSRAAAVSPGSSASGVAASTSGAGFSSASSGRSLTPRIIG